MQFDEKLRAGTTLLPLAFPASMAAAVDHWHCLTTWAKADDSDRAVLYRLYASAIGLCLDRKHKHSKKAPAYDISSGDFIGYGTELLDWLGANVVSFKKVLRVGSELCNWMASELIRDDEVLEMEDFTEASQAQ